MDRWIVKTNFSKFTISVFTFFKINFQFLADVFFTIHSPPLHSELESVNKKKNWILKTVAPKTIDMSLAEQKQNIVDDFTKLVEKHKGEILQLCIKNNPDIIKYMVNFYQNIVSLLCVLAICLFRICLHFHSTNLKAYILTWFELTDKLIKSVSNRYVFVWINR